MQSDIGVIVALWVANNWLWLIGGVSTAIYAALTIVYIFAFGKLWVKAPLGVLWYLLFALPSTILMKVVSVIIAYPLGLIAAIFGVDKLPFPLSLFHTHDISLNPYPRQPDWPDVSQKGAVGKVHWYAKWIMRNPAYGYMGLIGKTKTDVELIENANYLGHDSWDGVRKHSCDGFPSARGNIGPFYVWCGWKFDRPESKSMVALAIKIST